MASAEGKKMQLLITLGDSEALGGYINVNNWNQIHLIARGNTLIHVVNGHVMSVVIDNDKTKFRTADRNLDYIGLPKTSTSV